MWDQAHEVPQVPVASRTPNTNARLLNIPFSTAATEKHIFHGVIRCGGGNFAEFGLNAAIKVSLKTHGVMAVLEGSGCHTTLGNTQNLLALKTIPDCPSSHMQCCDEHNLSPRILMAGKQSMTRSINCIYLRLTLSSIPFTANYCCLSTNNRTGRQLQTLHSLLIKTPLSFSTVADWRSFNPVSNTMQHTYSQQLSRDTTAISHQGVHFHEAAIA